MSYYYYKIIQKNIGESRNYVEAKLKEKGFGIVSEINMSSKFKEKLDIDFRPYIILGACSPKHAYKAVSAEEHIGLMLPCNVVLQEKSAGSTLVSVIDPIASMQAVENISLVPVAQEIQTLLRSFITDL
jgi:uncharacterized protein (DUF302 family)